MNDISPQKIPQNMIERMSIAAEAALAFDRTYHIPDTDLYAGLAYHCDWDKEMDLDDEFEYVYVISCREFSKIGVSKNVPARMRSIQTANPVEVEVQLVLAPIDGQTARELESALHREFKNYHIRGEWFDCAAADTILDRI